MSLQITLEIGTRNLKKKKKSQQKEVCKIKWQLFTQVLTQ